MTNYQHIVITIIGIFVIMLITVSVGYHFGRSGRHIEKINTVTHKECPEQSKDTLVFYRPMDPYLIYSCGREPSAPLCWQVRKFLYEEKGIYQDSSFYKFMYIP